MTITPEMQKIAADGKTIIRELDKKFMGDGVTGDSDISCCNSVVEQRENSNQVSTGGREFDSQPASSPAKIKRFNDTLVDFSVIRTTPNPGKRPPSYARLLQEDGK